jgi:hypothetical protein
VDALCDRLAGVEQSLVIDDLQRFDDREGERALLSLMMRLSPNVRWMLSTRRVPRAYRRLDFRRALLMASVLEIYNSPVRGFVTMLNSGQGATGQSVAGERAGHVGIEAVADHQLEHNGRLIAGFEGRGIHRLAIGAHGGADSRPSTEGAPTTIRYIQPAFFSGNAGGVSGLRQAEPARLAAVFLLLSCARSWLKAGSGFRPIG